MANSPDELIVTARNVTDVRRIVERQRALIEKLNAAGHDTADHKKLLTVFENTLNILKDHERALRHAWPRVRRLRKK